MTDAEIQEAIHDSLMRSFAHYILTEFIELHDIDESLVTEEFVRYHLRKWQEE